MKISYNWLRTYIDLEASAGETAEMLTMAGLEVDGIERQQASLDGVVVGHVLETRPHPNADRLTLCSVDLGAGEPVQIVCGAPNVAADQRVPVATVGTTLHLPSRENPDERQPVTLRRAKIRGEVSEGMICAEDELGLSADHRGIMVLSDDSHVGEPLREYLERAGVEVGDATLDVAVTPNRPDAVSHLGVARDLAALLDRPLQKPAVSIPEDGDDRPEYVRLEIDAPEQCPRYVAMLVRGVTIEESPAWLKQRLTAVGLRPRNNVVDVTNFVMYECGQPLHAFDADEIADRTIRVRLSEPGEQFTTLDSKERKLPEGTLLICDAERPVAIAGVMGGENSEVTDRTTNVLVESAYFDPSTIRRAAKALGMQTDASYRFERGVDREGQLWAAARAAQLIAELGGGDVEPAAVDAHPMPAERPTIELRYSRIGRVLGVDVPEEEVVRLLRAIGFDVEPLEDSFRCVVPSFRPDVEREVDVIEEVARLFGFDRVPEPTKTVVPSGTVPRERPLDRVRDTAREVLTSSGYREIYTNSLLREETARRFLVPKLSWLPDGDVVTTLNPISQEMSALRPSLLPGALEVLRHNRNRGADRLRLFEMGHVFRGNVENGGVVPGYAEEEALVALLTGPRYAASWASRGEASDFFDLKGLLEETLDRLRVRDVRLEASYEATTISTFHLGVFSGETLIGIAGRLADDVAESWDLEDPVFFLELGIDRLVSAAGAVDTPTYRPVSRYPQVERDLAFAIGADQDVWPIAEKIQETGGELLQSVTLFDVYRGEGVAEGRKSTAFSLRFGADRTLTDDEVDRLVKRIVASVQEEFAADLRQ